MCSAMAFDFSPHFWHDEYHFPVNNMSMNRKANRTCLLYRGKGLLRDHNYGARAKQSVFWLDGTMTRRL